MSEEKPKYEKHLSFTGMRNGATKITFSYPDAQNQLRVYHFAVKDMRGLYPQIGSESVLVEFDPETNPNAPKHLMLPTNESQRRHLLQYFDANLRSGTIVASEKYRDYLEREIKVSTNRMRELLIELNNWSERKSDAKVRLGYMKKGENKNACSKEK